MHGATRCAHRLVPGSVLWKAREVVVGFSAHFDEHADAELLGNLCGVPSSSRLGRQDQRMADDDGFGVGVWVPRVVDTATRQTGLHVLPTVPVQDHRTGLDHAHACKAVRVDGNMVRMCEQTLDLVAPDPLLLRLPRLQVLLVH